MTLGIAWLSVAALGLLVMWLAIVAIRLRFESLINRRVIASLQKVRPIQEAKNPWWTLSLQIPAGVWFVLALAVLVWMLVTLE